MLDDDSCAVGVCTRDESLAPGLGRCFEPIAECETDGECDDGVACTENRCVDGSCFYAPDDAACDDAFACTSGTCDTVRGCVVETDDSACDDGLACTDDLCIASAGCVFTPVNSRCNDGVACTDDRCDGTLGCVAAPVNSRCSDGVACTTDVCDVTLDCVRTPTNSLCNDGDACTNDICGAAGCEFPDNGTCPDTPTYADVLPIYQSKCAGCHTGSNSGGFRATVYSTFFLAASHVSCTGQDKGNCSLTRIRNGTMPPSGCTGNPDTDASRPGCLNRAQQELLAEWIAAGMPE